MTFQQHEQDERARRFREVVLPCLDDAYALARFLMRNQADAEDCVQECYLRAFSHFDSWRGTNIRAWLFTILRNVCYSEFSRRDRRETPADMTDDGDAAETAFWMEPQTLPDAGMIEREDGEAVRRLVQNLPAPFREVIALREFNEMSYREIAGIIGAPVGTVMSRLARARALLAIGWNARVNPKRPNVYGLTPARPSTLSRHLARS